MNELENERIACDPTLSRKQFIERVVKGAVVTGAILAGPKVLDKFLVPPAYASASSCAGPISASNAVSGNTDTITVPGTDYSQFGNGGTDTGAFIFSC